jgi:hypothetical protein
MANPRAGTRLSEPFRHHTSVLARLPRTRQVLSFTAFAVLHMHVASSEAKWMPFGEPLTPAQITALHGVTRTGVRR